MSEVTVLPAVKRERVGKGAARAVRREGLVPGVIYGKKEDPILFQMDPRPLLKAMHRPGFFSTVFKIDVKGAREYTVLPKDVQLHPVSDQPIHVDMLRFDKDAKITVGVSVRFINDDICPGIKKGGVLNVVRHEVEVVCSPANMPTEFVIDLAKNEVGRFHPCFRAKSAGRGDPDHYRSRFHHRHHCRADRGKRNRDRRGGRRGRSRVGFNVSRLSAESVPSRSPAQPPMLRILNGWLGGGAGWHRLRR